MPAALGARGARRAPRRPTSSTSTRALLPAGDDATATLLGLFEIEKAVYELRYELHNRPDWVGIPVAGIVRLLEAEPA